MLVGLQACVSRPYHFVSDLSTSVYLQVSETSLRCCRRSTRELTQKPALRFARTPTRHWLAPPPDTPTARARVLSCYYSTCPSPPFYITSCAISQTYMFFNMASLQRIVVSLLLICTFAFVFLGQSVSAAKGPKITHKVSISHRALIW